MKKLRNTIGLLAIIGFVSVSKAETFMIPVGPPADEYILGYTIDYGEDWEHMTNRMVFPYALQPVVEAPNYGLFVSGLKPSTQYFYEARVWNMFFESGTDGWIYYFTTGTNFWETAQVSFKQAGAGIQHSTNLLNWSGFQLPNVYSNFICGYPLKDGSRFFKGATNMAIKLFPVPPPEDHGSVGMSDGYGAYGYELTRITNSSTDHIWFTSLVGATNAVLTDSRVGMPPAPGGSGITYRPVFVVMRKRDLMTWWGTNTISWPVSTGGTNEFKVYLYNNDPSLTNETANITIDWRY